MASNKAKLLIVASLILVGGGAVLALSLRPRERALMPRASRIVQMSGRFPYYWWLSDHEVMRFRDPARGDWTFLRLNTKTKKEEPIEQLTRLFVRSGGKPDSVQVSPDGKWALWTGGTGGTVVATTDGRRHFDYPPGKPSEKRWMCESVRWIELLHEDDKSFTSAILHNVVDAKESARRWLQPPIPISPQYTDVPGMAPTTDDHILASIYVGGAGHFNPAVILALELGPHIERIGKFTLQPPRGCDRGQIVFDPIYGNLVWVLHYRPSLAALTGASARTGLWVTNMHGWATQEVGSLDSTSESGPYTVRWSPDGSRLSFVYRDWLWSVPAY